MFKKYLYADKHKDYSSRKSCLVLIFAAEFMSHNNADYRKHECCAADYCYRRNNIYLKKRKGYAHRKSVDAGCDRKSE